MYVTFVEGRWLNVKEEEKDGDVRVVGDGLMEEGVRGSASEMVEKRDVEMMVDGDGDNDTGGGGGM
jgi:hypothetical protein